MRLVAFVEVYAIYRALMSIGSTKCYVSFALCSQIPNLDRFVH